MTKKTAYNPIPDDLDDRLDRLARDRGVPRLVTAGDAAPIMPAAPSSAARMVKKTFDLPEYVLDALNLKATAEKSSAAFLILKALSDAGTVTVDPADLIPDRRRKGRA